MKRWREIRQYLVEKGVEYDFLESENYGSAERQARMFADNGYETIVVVGGDGVLQDALNGILSSEYAGNVSLGIIPNGIANDFATYWGLRAGDYKTAIDCIIARRIRKVDVGCCSYNTELGEEKRAEIEALIAVDDGKKGGAADPERFVHPPIEELPFAKLSDGFIRACAILLNEAVCSQTGISCAHPMMIQELEDGVERIYFYNKYDNAYINVVVDSEYTVESAEIVSDFPVLPVKFVDEEERSGFFDYSKASSERKHFQIRIAPDGLTIVDIKRKK